MTRINRIFGPEFKWRRFRSLILGAGLTAYLLVLLAATSCVAQQVQQTTDQDTGQTYSQQSGQVLDPLTDQPVDQLSDQQAGQRTGQQPNQTSNDSQSNGTNSQAGQTTNQRSGQSQNQASSQQPPRILGKQKMSAGQLISILENHSEILLIIKAQLAQETRVEPESISDETVYERIRQDASLRGVVTRVLIRSGFLADLEALNPDFVDPTKDQSLRQMTAQQQEDMNPETAPYQDPDNPQVQRRLSPYMNMPSLSDLYAQFPTTEKKLRRFGSNAFMTVNTGANQVPMDLPAGPDYVLGPGDSLTVNMWGGLSARLKRTVDRQGQIALPEAGTIMLSNLTIAQAQVEIQKALDSQFNGEHVEISLERLRTVRVYVVGDVQRPGAYDVSSLSTLLGALYAAGGPTGRGSLRSLRQYRDGKLVHQVDLYDFLLRGVRSNDDRLLPGDTILVPPVGPQVAVEGAVRRPAIYELNGEESLSQVLDLAGGLLVSASLKQIDVERIEAHQSRTMLSLRLDDNQEKLNQELAAFHVRDGDDVNIKQISPYNSQVVYLEGHVYHPGKYPYRDGMTLSDILRSYQDVMPEPADHAELVRLQPPDFRPQTLSIDLPDVMIGNQTIPLQPFDLIRIYGRYEVDSPSVEVKGEVLRPGKYPMSQGMTASELVRMAGGFRRSAFRDVAEIASYSVINGQNVEVNHRDIKIEQAIDGDKNADVLLKPGDVVGIRRIAGWQDIGATLTITGEVEHPGSYGIQDGERLSSVLKRAGGFRADAYPYAARFERVQVRELNEQARLQMIRRIQDTPVTVNQRAGNQAMSPEQAQKALEEQRQQILMTLRSRTASGRMVINISSNISSWANTPADIELRAGDTLVIPKKANFVMASGQVYNPIAISYVPGKRLGWYFRKAGGTTPSADKKRMYLLRADGSVVPKRRGLLSQDFMDLRVRPGDNIVVPEKIASASQTWQNLQATADALTSIMIPLAVTGVI